MGLFKAFLLKLIERNPEASNSNYAEALQASTSYVRKLILELEEEGEISRAYLEQQRGLKEL